MRIELLENRMDAESCPISAVSSQLEMGPQSRAKGDIDIVHKDVVYVQTIPLFAIQCTEQSQSLIRGHGE